MNEIVVGQSDITAAQMKDFWRQVGDGSITRQYLQGFLECPVEKRRLSVGVKVVDQNQSMVVPTLHSTGPTLAEWLKAREELHKFFTGETVTLQDVFTLTDEELASTALMPAFRSAGATNQMAVEWKRRMGVKVFVEDEDKGVVMRYKHSKGLKEPELYLINRSDRPDKDTLGKNAKSPDQLVAVPNKLWLGLFGWCDADTLYHAIIGAHLDPETVTWFPLCRLSDGRVADGYWSGEQVLLYWSFAGFCFPHCGARSAKKVPLKP